MHFSGSVHFFFLPDYSECSLAATTTYLLDLHVKCYSELRVSMDQTCWNSDSLKFNINYFRAYPAIWVILLDASPPSMHPSIIYNHFFQFRVAGVWWSSCLGAKRRSPVHHMATHRSTTTSLYYYNFYSAAASWTIIPRLHDIFIRILYRCLCTTSSLNCCFAICTNLYMAYRL